MPRQYQGSIISKSPITPAGPYQCGKASGVWTIDQMVGWQKAGLWPVAGNVQTGNLAIFALGSVSCTPSTTRNKYTYSGCVNASATSSSATSNAGSAAGNSVAGIFTLSLIHI